jgi:hypothetical protein
VPKRVTKHRNEPRRVREPERMAALAIPSLCPVCAAPIVFFGDVRTHGMRWHCPRFCNVESLQPACSACRDWVEDTSVTAGERRFYPRLPCRRHQQVDPEQS